MYEPNPALRVLNRWFFDKIQVDEAWVREVREIVAPRHASCTCCAA